MEPSKKSPEMEAFLENVFGRTSAITGEKCVDPPIGCGQPVEGTFHNPIEEREYPISGMCGNCQRAFFGTNNYTEED
jgi:hypothetical protein